jgi:hypothetical protein
LGRSAGLIGRSAPYVRLSLESHRSRMTGTGPGRKQQEKARVCEGIDFVALLGRYLHQSPGLGRRRRAGVARDPYLTADNGEPRTLMDLVVLEHLPRGKVKHDGASLLSREQDLRALRSPVQALEIPVVHWGQSCSSTRLAHCAPRESLINRCRTCGASARGRRVALVRGYPNAARSPDHIRQHDLDQRAVQTGSWNTHDAAEARDRRGAGFHDRAAS